MKPRSAFLFATVFGSITLAAIAQADVPACPASLGGYTAAVQGNNVTICPTTAPVPGLGRAATCPYTLGMVRLNVADGGTEGFTGPCVADPQMGDAGADADAGTPCYVDTCVAPGTYEYGYALPAFGGCNGGCAGQTSGEHAVVAIVTSPVSGCTPSSSGFTPTAPWSYVDAAIVDGAVPWSGICHGPLPDPDGGYCAWDWAPDGSPEWAQCPPDGGSLCPGYENDGAVVPVLCTPPLDGGPTAIADASSSEPDAGSTSTAPEEGGASSPPTSSDGGGSTSGNAPPASPDASSSTASKGSGQSSNDTGDGCSAVNGVGATPLGPLFALGLGFVIRAARRKRRERRSA